MKMVVGICDDKNASKRTAHIINNYAEQTLLEIEIYCFTNQKELFSHNGKPLDVLFLEIALEDDNGIILALEVNKKWENCHIVFLTNHLHYATEVYETKHTYFVLKDQFAGKVGKVFYRISHEMEVNTRKLVFKGKNMRGGYSLTLSPEEIYYFERNNRKTKIRTTWGDYEINDGIGELITRLPETDFLRCHSSYIVYIPNVKEASKGMFIMNNGDVITISRAYEKSAKAGYQRWMLARI